MTRPLAAPAHPGVAYRPEIDGLRAVAVVPVILFHAGIGPFRGGFVGVDIFFVISGFLITSILMTDIAGGHYSIANFYEKRARRILPALFVMLATCLPFAWAWMLPDQWHDFAQSLTGVSLFASNIVFWQGSDYFAASSEYMPLLHTWSLAVEEQYYLFFPIFLAALWPLGPRRLLWLIAACAFASLLLSEWAWRHLPSANFYLAPTRVWELFAGSIAAIIVRNRGPRAHQGLAMAGLIGVAVSLFLFDETVPFPSVYALLPIVGVMAILIWGTAETWAGRILANRLFTSIGLISYSAYLWHQPLLTFARIRTLGQPPAGLMPMLALASLGLGYLSWRYVERPFRGSSSRFDRRAIFTLSLAGLALFLAIGLWGSRTQAKQASLSAAQRQLAEYGQSKPAKLYAGPRHCYIGAAQSSGDFGPACGGSGNTVIWADSHGAALAPGLRALVPDIGQFTSAACPPLLGYADPARPGCTQINAFVLDHLRRHPPRQLILFAYWGNHPHDDIHGLLSSTLAELNQMGIRRITVIGSMPEFTPTLPQRLIATGATLDRPNRAFSSDSRTGPADRAVATAAREHGARFVPLRSRLCRDDLCEALVASPKGLVPLVWDTSHLSEGGSLYLARRLTAEGALPLK
ncbi:acyltransferase family protein [Novosphingobium colocasiae]|uniref:Acyltransferase n=1 Tax=Novosphingobium colocasiae TaxID=1256513 RepID=A0A918UEP2_9SPHN|nr:acyltransferase family protein [Novosphingobium colocasiae]GGY96706.1 acyltransferase [Novosphingobium colocasiae]